MGDWLTVPARVADSSSAWAIYAVLLPDGAARERLQEAGVPTAVYYPRALHHQPAVGRVRLGCIKPALGSRRCNRSRLASLP